ncbi:MAG: uracil-DNA glycosylase, partial [Alkalispirochaetaceae bacterium]
ALRFLTGETAPIGTIHGNLYEYRGIPLMATYHPSGVLRNPEYRRPVWEDLKKLRDQVLRPKAGE